MPIISQVDDIDRDIELIIRETLSPAARSQMLVEFARDQLGQAQEANRQALGNVPPHDTFVDGVLSDRLETVRPDGEIAFEFKLVTDVLEWIADQLQRHSPRRSGDYERSHILLADGVAVDTPVSAPSASEYIFVNSQPYARKIERGLSNEAPDGIYQVVAELARRRFGNAANIAFIYRSPFIGYVRGGRGREGRAVMKNGHLSHVNLAMKYERSTRSPAILITV